MKFSIKDLFSKCDQICSKLRKHLLRKSLMENFIFYAVFMVAKLLLLLINILDTCMNAIVAAASFLKQFHYTDLFTVLLLKQKRRCI